MAQLDAFLRCEKNSGYLIFVCISLLQVFLASANQADNWITNKQNTITSESNDNLDTVHTQLKTQLNFEKSIAAYEMTIDALNQSANNLIEKNNFKTDIIKRRQAEVMEKWRKLKGLAASKSEKLGESKLLFQFLRDADEVNSSTSYLFYLLLSLSNNYKFMIIIEKC